MLFLHLSPSLPSLPHIILRLSLCLLSHTTVSSLWCESTLSSSLRSSALARLGHEEILLSLLFGVGGTTRTSVGLELFASRQHLRQPFGLGFAFSLGRRHDHVRIDGTLDANLVLAVVVVGIPIVLAQFVEFSTLGNRSLSSSGLSWISAGLVFPLDEFSHLGKVGSREDARGSNVLLQLVSFLLCHLGQIQDWFLLFTVGLLLFFGID
mmetsp:Transcript_5034/g.11214  ORF Transcript_5034/g.11214 Transcript_5034/m.11214 type:complete len:209 (+) Transcript_5034:66-692(+)